jgi:hypothetical protein
MGPPTTDHCRNPGCADTPTFNVIISLVVLIRSVTGMGSGLAEVLKTPEQPAPFDNDLDATRLFPVRGQPSRSVCLGGGCRGIVGTKYFELMSF